MQVNIHPKYFGSAQVTCSCGNRFTVGSTLEFIRVELCNKCHPFYTGEQKFVDRASQIQRFQKKQEVAKQHAMTKVKKIEQKKQKEDQPKSLREMLQAVR